MEENNHFQAFFASYNDELLSKLKRLDGLIGRDHWLSVGTYKESILRDLLSKSLPGKYKVDTGFVLTADKFKQPIKSRQIDILIWDHMNYSPVFVDSSLVVIPPEACGAVIEVKSKLTSSSLKDCLEKADAFMEFTRMPNFSTYWTNTRKYIFAYELDKSLSFPEGVFRCIDKYYGKSSGIPIKERMNFCKHVGFDHKWNYLSSIDAIFILSHGAIIRDWRYPNDFPRMIFKAYSTKPKDHDHTFGYLEYDLQSHLGSKGHQGQWFYDQPGLYETKKSLQLEKALKRATMIFPALNTKPWKDLDERHLYPSKTKLNLDEILTPDEGK